MSTPLIGTNLHSSHRNLQNLNTPDIDLERDLIDGETLLGMQSTEMSADKRSIVNISTILISALIFLVVLAWFDLIQTAFFDVLVPESSDPIPAQVKLWYAIFITLFVFILVVLIFHHNRDTLR